jgi:hypothetical protein
VRCESIMWTSDHSLRDSSSVNDRLIMEGITAVAAMPSRRDRDLRDALVCATFKLGQIDAYILLCMFSGSQIVMMPCSDD